MQKLLLGMHVWPAFLTTAGRAAMRAPRIQDARGPRPAYCTAALKPPARFAKGWRLMARVLAPASPHKPFEFKRSQTCLGRLRKLHRETARKTFILLTESSAWQSVAVKYDVRRMSRDGLRGLAHDLFTAGAISLPDFRLLSLEPVTYAPQWPDFSVFETPAERGDRRDWIAEIQKRIQKGSAEYGYVAYQQSLLSFLKRVEAAGPARPAPAVKTLASPVALPGARQSL